MSLFSYDKVMREGGYALLCGVDEAGRGPLAGPVYAAAVILPSDLEIQGLNDSKKLSERKREALFEQITVGALSYGIAFADEKEIDRLNILGATLLAMSRAVAMLYPKPELVLVDGNRAPELESPTRTVIKGDGISASIAAASILAKVSRDRKLIELDREYPHYQFAKHKGYPTGLHYEMLGEYGVSPVHRESFLKKWRAVRHADG